MKTKLYLGSDKADNHYRGEQLGLSEKALSMFRYALYEVIFEVDIDETTGEYIIEKVIDGNQVLVPNKEAVDNSVPSLPSDEEFEQTKKEVLKQYKDGLDYLKDK